jgi:hypothetical protein
VEYLPLSNIHHWVFPALIGLRLRNPCDHKEIAIIGISCRLLLVPLESHHFDLAGVERSSLTFQILESALQILLADYLVDISQTFGFNSVFTPKSTFLSHSTLLHWFTAVSAGGNTQGVRLLSSHKSCFLSLGCLFSLSKHLQ